MRKAIVFVITSLGIGGAETQLVQLTTRLKQRGWAVKVVSLLPLRGYADELQEADIPVRSLDIQRKIPDPHYFLQLARFIRQWKPAVVHSHMFHANLLARLSRPLANPPVLISTAVSVREGGRIRELLYRLTDPLCDMTVQICQAGMERYVQVGAVPAHKIRHIPNGVDTERFRPDPAVRQQARCELGVDKLFTWLAVGRLEQPKDYPNMLRAFARVRQAQTDTILLIAGDGPLHAEIEALVHTLGIGSSVRLLGLRQDVPALMNAADAFVLSSSREGLPNVLLEAHATGLPAVVTNVGGNREVLLNETTGFLVSPGDPVALAEGMLRLMTLPEQERRRMGQHAREHILANFSIDTVVEQWENLYLELLQRKGISIERFAH
ncbi:MAG: glycosyltransferase [Armatimonadota bacterium]